MAAGGTAPLHENTGEPLSEQAVDAQARLVMGLAPSPFLGGAEDVEVRGHKLEESLPRDLKGYRTRVVTVDRQQIQNAGQPDVATSLELLAPGLYISPKNGPFDYVDVSLQGSRTQDVLWLLDGVRLNNRLYGGTTPLDTFPASIVDHFEMVEGPEALFSSPPGTLQRSGLDAVPAPGAPAESRRSGRRAALSGSIEVPLWARHRSSPRSVPLFLRAPRGDRCRPSEGEGSACCDGPHHAVQPGDR
ncbi:MAG: TonB-dependent receptor plug domain-containing protein [Polyangiaceae bacterium]